MCSATRWTRRLSGSQNDFCCFVMTRLDRAISGARLFRNVRFDRAISRTKICHPGLDPLLSGLNFVDGLHGVDSTRVQTLDASSGHELGGNTVRHQNSVFHDLLKRIPWATFERLVATHGADRRVRRLATKSQFIALLYGQLSGAASLREIVGGLESHALRLYHVGGHDDFFEAIDDRRRPSAPARPLPSARPDSAARR